MTVLIGVAGAPTLPAATGTARGGADDPGLTIARTATGTYNLTYPKGKAAWIEVAILDIGPSAVGWHLTAQAPTSGTATFRTLGGTNAAAATDATAGSQLSITIAVER